jgi:hypothetical protein
MNLTFFTRLPRIGSLAAVGLAVAAMAASASAGNITFSITNQTAGTNALPISSATGGSGSFDVVLTDTAADKLYQYQFDLFVNQGSSNINFIGTNPVGTPAASNAYSSIEFTTAPYVFAGNSGESGNSEVAVFPNQGVSNTFGNEVTNSDIVNSNATAPVLGATGLAMANVVFNVPAGTPAGTYTLVFNQDSTSTDPFADWVNTVSNSDAGQPSPFAAISGSIVVSTPEPGSVVMLLLGAVGLIGFGVRRARRV